MATQINNYASATYAYTGKASQESVISNTATTNLITEFAISGYKESLNSSFRAGQNITYFIHISNDGTSPLYNVTVSDDLGGSGNVLNYVSSSASLNVNGVVSSINPTTVNPLTFVLPNTFNSGDLATITYVCQVSSGIGDSVTEITNTATIQANEESTTGPVISVSPSPSVTLPLEDYAQVSMAKSVSTNEINIGEQFSYTLTLLNSGNLDAINVTITDTLPQNFVVSSITSVTDGVQTTYAPSDYEIDSSTNTLTLPVSTSSVNIIVPASTTAGDGTTLITINGSITE